MKVTHVKRKQCCEDYPFCEHATNANHRTCIKDGCGMPFNSNEPEKREQITLRPFWQRYCPKHRTDGQVHIPIVEVRHTPGDWRTKSDTIFCAAQIWAGDRLLANVFGETREIGKANAELMAKSSKLLKALQGVIHHNAAVKPEYQLPASLIREIEQTRDLGVRRAKHE